jgi:ABC-type phosphate transport system substrate-binding protein
MRSSMVGVKKFGDCVISLEHTTDIAAKTATEAGAIGYSGLTARREGNLTLAVAKNDGESGVLPTVSTIRRFAYPLARKLFVYEASGAVVPSEAERELLNLVLDRSFMDPIMQDSEFYTVD